jgi:crotonobetainyl-CoA:carnitine CoA-transferase CaiB-like acyl-CoA transferase
MSEKRIRRRENGELPALNAMLDLLRIDTSSVGRIALEGEDFLIRTRHQIAHAASTAQMLIGAAAVSIWHARTGIVSDISLDTTDALHSLHSSHYVWQQDAFMEVGAEYVPINGFHPTRDGRKVLLVAGPPYMKLFNGYLDTLDCSHNKKAIAAATMRFTAEELEEKMAAAGLPCCRAFDRDEWLAHPQGAALVAAPVIDIEKIADGEPVPFQRNGEHPLDGIRVMDFTHVLAGPRSTQTLAELGAEVLHISAASHSDTLAQHLGVDLGKYCAYLDLTKDEQLKKMHELSADADVFATSYRPAVNERFGLTPAELASRSKNGIIAMSANAYGHSGPWASRSGFDPIGQAASGFSAAEGAGVDDPAPSPIVYLTDLLTGYFAAAGMMAALLRRSEEGGSYHVKVSLTRSAMWVLDLGRTDEKLVSALPSRDILPYRTKVVQTAFGTVTQLANPLRYSAVPLSHNERLVPFGADRPEWQKHD